MIYKNAGIKTIEEAVQRLVNGEIFYMDVSYKMKCQLFMNTRYINPFIAISGENWNRYKEWEVKVEWYENLGGGVLCWIWDDELGENMSLGIVTDYINDLNYPYCAHSNWKFAEPVKPGELEKYILK